jgi:putative transposase
MSRLRRIEIIGRHFFITTCLSRRTLPLSPPERDICLEQLAEARAKHSFSLFAYVVMPDHAHVLLQTNDSLLPDLMRDWKSASGFAIAKARRKSGAICQPRYFDFILRRGSDFGSKVEYIHNNPVSAGLAARPDDWPWSSAAFYTKRSSIPLEPDVFSFSSDPSAPL